MRLILSAVSSYVMVALLGAGPGLYLDFAVLSFHVPTVGSAATRVAANPKRANTSFVCRDWRGYGSLAMLKPSPHDRRRRRLKNATPGHQRGDGGSGRLEIIPVCNPYGAGVGWAKARYK